MQKAPHGRRDLIRLAVNEKYIALALCSYFSTAVEQSLTLHLPPAAGEALSLSRLQRARKSTPSFYANEKTTLMGGFSVGAEGGI